MWPSLSQFSTETWILITSFLILTGWQYFRHLHIPYDPPTIWNLGNMKNFYSKEAFTYENNMKKKYGPVWGSFNVLSPSITVHDPDILAQIFIKEFHAFPERLPFLKDIVGELHVGLNVAVENAWKRSRSTLTPVFSTAKIRRMVHIIDRCTSNTIRALDQIIKDKDGVFEGKKFFSRLSLDIISSAAFSAEVNSQSDEDEEPEISRMAKELLSGSFFGPLSVFVYLYPPLGKIFRYFKFSMFPRGAVRYFEKVIDFLVKEHQTDHSKKNRQLDIMQLMIDCEISEEEAKSGNREKGLTRKEIIANSVFIFLAGHGNVANALNCMAYSFAQYPDIQRKAQKEVDEIIKEYGKFDYDNAERLKYMDMCLNETLRLYNPVLRNGRACYEEMTINGFTFPKGVIVNVPTYALCHDPEYWENPEEFYPERMRNMDQIDPLVFQPFGAGPRNCIGLRFAVMEIKMCMAKLLHEFSFETTPDTPKPPLKLAVRITVSPAKPILLRAVRRTKKQ